MARDRGFNAFRRDRREAKWRAPSESWLPPTQKPPADCPGPPSVAQITRMAPHARRTYARIASIESEFGTRVPSEAVNPDSLCFSEVFRSAPFEAIATESSEPRCPKDGSIPTASTISRAATLLGSAGSHRPRGLPTFPCFIRASRRLVNNPPVCPAPSRPVHESRRVMPRRFVATRIRPMERTVARPRVQSG